MASQAAARPWPRWRGQRRRSPPPPRSAPHAPLHTTIHAALASDAEARTMGHPEMAQGVVAMLVCALLATHFIALAQPPVADKSIAKDRIFRLSAGKTVAKPTKLGFFGTIFHLVLEQINDTKSAYNQVSELVNNQFVDDNAVTPEPEVVNGTTTESNKISRQEFLNILDRNLKGLARLRALEWREARKDSWANLQGYKDELFGGKNNGKR